MFGSLINSHSSRTPSSSLCLRGIMSFSCLLQVPLPFAWEMSSSLRLPFASFLGHLHEEFYFQSPLPFTSLLFLLHGEKPFWFTLTLCKYSMPFAWEKCYFLSLLTFCKYPFRYALNKLSSWLTFCKYSVPFAWEERISPLLDFCKASMPFAEEKLLHNRLPNLNLVAKTIFFFF